MMTMSTLGRVGLAVAVAAFALPLASMMAKAETLDDRIVAAVEAGALEGLHAVIAIHQGDTLVEAYFPGRDWRWGEDLGVRDHGPETLHDIRSVTKSIVGLLYGIALEEGLVPGLDAPLIAQFPSYADLATDPERAAILVRHALTMTMGTEWDESVPYTSAANSEVAMEQADDRYRFVLDRPMVTDPGTQWVYNGGATAVIGKLIADGSGMSLQDFARSRLFAPLGIEQFDWITGADGVPSAASGLRLTVPDLTKIGLMIANGGMHDGQQIVPSAWLDEAFTAHAQTGIGLRYGYFWWLSPADGPHWVAGFGNGGQRLTVSTRDDLVVVVLAGNYNAPEHWRLPVRLINAFIAPEVISRLGGDD
ncbi:MAG: serine hydrolase domain-containing protein [Pseudomonadota bacterium]